MLCNDYEILENITGYNSQVFYLYTGDGWQTTSPPYTMNTFDKSVKTKNHLLKK